MGQKLVMKCLPNIGQISDQEEELRNGILPAISVNKWCHSHQWLQPLPTVVSRWTLRGLRMRKHTILAPESWGAYHRNDSRELRLSYLTIYRKALNFLTWDIWFSLINNNLLTSDYLPFIAKLYILALSLEFSKQFSQGYLRCCLPGLKC